MLTAFVIWYVRVGSPAEPHAELGGERVRLDVNLGGVLQVQPDRDGLDRARVVRWARTPPRPRGTTAAGLEVSARPPRVHSTNRSAGTGTTYSTRRVRFLVVTMSHDTTGRRGAAGAAVRSPLAGRCVGAPTPNDQRRARGRRRRLATAVVLRASTLSLPRVGSGLSPNEHAPRRSLNRRRGG